MPAVRPPVRAAPRRQRPAELLRAVRQEGRQGGRPRAPRAVQGVRRDFPDAQPIDRVLLGRVQEKGLYAPPQRGVGRVRRSGRGAVRRPGEGKDGQVPHMRQGVPDRHEAGQAAGVLLAPLPRRGIARADARVHAAVPCRPQEAGRACGAPARLVGPPHRQGRQEPHEEHRVRAVRGRVFDFQQVNPVLLWPVPQKGPRARRRGLQEAPPGARRGDNGGDRKVPRMLQGVCARARGRTADALLLACLPGRVQAGLFPRALSHAPRQRQPKRQRQRRQGRRQRRPPARQLVAARRRRPTHWPGRSPAACAPRPCNGRGRRASPLRAVQGLGRKRGRKGDARRVQGMRSRVRGAEPRRPALPWPVPQKGPCAPPRRRPCLRPAPRLRRPRLRRPPPRGAGMARLRRGVRGRREIRPAAGAMPGRLPRRGPSHPRVRAQAPCRPRKAGRLAGALWDAGRVRRPSSPPGGGRDGTAAELPARQPARPPAASQPHL